MQNRWLPVIGGVLMNLALGSLYGWSVFVAPLEKEFHWTRAQTSLTYTVAVVFFALSFMIGGRLQDKKGPRICAFIGGVLVSAGFFLSSYTSSLMWLYVAFGVIVGVGNGFGYATPIPVASKWFPDKRGLVVGLMVGAYGAGSAILGPLATSLINDPNVGWRATFQILGALFFVMTMVGTLLIKNPPAGYRPPNWQPKPGAAAAGRDFTTAEMLATPTFYLMWIAYCLGTTAGQMAISQLVPFARSAGLGAAAAVLVLPVSATGNAGGRILSGWLSDTLGRLSTLKTMILISAVAMPVLYIVRQQQFVFFVLVAIVYWCYGTQLSVFATTTADFYGTKNLGLNYGVLFSAWGAAGIIGPWFAGKTFDMFGDYRVAFFSAGGLAVVAFISIFMAKPPVHLEAHA
jgi:OFA family oxalate/formate antiporter-like MFS transporter